MKRIFERRVSELEARKRTRFAVIKQAYPGEPNAEAKARHYAAHPEDRDAELTVIIRKLTESPQ